MSNSQPTNDDINQAIATHIDGTVRATFCIFQYEDLQGILMTSGERPDRAWFYDVTVERNAISERVEVTVAEKDGILNIVRTETQS
jgi:hypothetical protein